jgi:predicted MFS family arabinose efflux permease
MASLAMFFHVDATTNSIAAAGMAVGAFGLLSSVTASLRGGLVDRLGQTRPLLIFIPAYTVSMLAMAFFANSATSCVVLAGIAGLACPPFNMSIRPLWQELAGPELTRPAYAFDSVLMNVASTAGPAVITGIALGTSSRVGLVVVGLAMLAGGSIILASPQSRNWRPEPRPDKQPSLVRHRAFQLMAFEGAAIGMLSGMLAVAIPAAAKQAGQSHTTGVIFSAASIGAIISGMFAGAKLTKVAPLRGLIVTQTALASVAFVLPLSHPGLTMAAIMFLSGLTNGPAHVFYMETVDAVRPPGTQVSSLAFLWTIEGSVAALGSAAAGRLVTATSPTTVMVIAAAFTIISPLAYIFGARGVLRPALKVPTQSAPDTRAAQDAIADAAHTAAGEPHETCDQRPAPVSKAD